MTVNVTRMLLILTLFLSVWKGNGQVFPLDMADESVDDAFDGCEEKMREKVESVYLKNDSEVFLKAWSEAQKKVKGNHGKLTQSQAAAIYLYTKGGKNPIYQDFNNVCRNGKQMYISGTFQFYTLYFFLTDAIQQLKKGKNNCLTSYRRTKSKFVNNVLNQNIRFGTFTSSSLFSNLTHFGEESCFEIETCFGAKVYKFSNVKTEIEVLIPPYEVFKVTDVIERTKQKDLWCKVVYKLKSTKLKESNLNCTKVHKNTKTMIFAV